MTIGQLVQQTGVPASTIRYYEQMGLLPKPLRASGRRCYAADAASRLAVVLLAQRCGFRIEEIRQLLHGLAPGTSPSERWRKFAAAKQAEIEARLLELIEMKRLLGRVLACECRDLQECGRKAIQSHVS